MTHKIYETSYGCIHYWTNDMVHSSVTLVFLPGLSADHRLFDRQVAYFENRCRLLVWDAPGHGASWPFDFSFTLRDKAQWLDAILQREAVASPILVGQSMGGYVGQMYSQLYPDRISGFIAIDSAPLQRRYVTSAEIWLLKHMTSVYRYCPWQWLLKLGVNGVATSNYGRDLMREMMMTYDGDKERYALLSGHGSRMLAEAMEADLPYEINCPILLICGDKDRAGSAIRYNRAWHNATHFPIEWIAGAGHNSNTDAPDKVNRLIEKFISNL